MIFNLFQPINQTQKREKLIKCSNFIQCLSTLNQDNKSAKPPIKPIFTKTPREYVTSHIRKPLFTPQGNKPEESRALEESKGVSNILTPAKSPEYSCIPHKPVSNASIEILQSVNIVDTKNHCGGEIFESKCIVIHVDKNMNQISPETNNELVSQSSHELVPRFGCSPVDDSLKQMPTVPERNPAVSSQLKNVQVFMLLH